ncbi:MAG: 1-phosphofructokinase family hexose kinase [Thermodesulfobacteriota bacterium]
MQTIVTLTVNPAIDKSASVENVVPERKLRCGAPYYEPGGGGINVSRAIHKLGGESTAFYLAGGPLGQMLISLLDQEGIDQRSAAIQGLTRQNFTVYEESTGQQFRFGMPGPEVQEKEWGKLLDALYTYEPRPAYIVASGSLSAGMPKDFYARIAKCSRELGARMILDTWGEPLSLAVREGVYLIKPNLRELGNLAGAKIEEEVEQEALALRIIEQGRSEIVVVSLGAAGALLVDKNGHERLRSPTVPIKSKVGAGDSMVAGITLRLAQGQSVIEAVRFGVAAGAAAVMTPGTELCRREDAENLYEKIVQG